MGTDESITLARSGRRSVALISCALINLSAGISMLTRDENQEQFNDWKKRNADKINKKKKTASQKKKIDQFVLKAQKEIFGNEMFLNGKLNQNYNPLRWKRSHAFFSACLFSVLLTIIQNFALLPMFKSENMDFDSHSQAS